MLGLLGLPFALGTSSSLAGLRWKTSRRLSSPTAQLYGRGKRARETPAGTRTHICGCGLKVLSHQTLPFSFHILLKVLMWGCLGIFVLTNGAGSRGNCWLVVDGLPVESSWSSGLGQFSSGLSRAVSVGGGGCKLRGGASQRPLGALERAGFESLL